jgi:hypothetical protein
MYCYDIDTYITPEYKKHALNLVNSIRGNWSITDKEKAPIGLRENNPELYKPFEKIQHLLTNYWKILILGPGESVLPHIDCNGQRQYKEWEDNIIVPAVINIPIAGTGHNCTKWMYTDSEITDPWAFYRGNKPNIEFEEIFNFTITDKPVLFNTGEWHSIDSTHNEERIMISLICSLDYTWEELVQQIISSN